MNVGLKDGIVYLTINMGNGEKEERIGEGRQFDDDYWHSVHIERESREVRCRPDSLKLKVMQKAYLYFDS